MATIERGNWSLRDPGDDIPDGSTINGGNFSQAVPDTEILAGKTLTINGGLWCNVAVDPAWTVNGGNWTPTSRCAYVHPEWVEKGFLDAEVENCPHVVEVIEVVGGNDVYIYEDSVVT